MGGMMSVTGINEPTKVGPAIADNYSGTYLSLGIVMALFQRERTGMGRRLERLDAGHHFLYSGDQQCGIHGGRSCV